MPRIWAQDAREWAGFEPAGYLLDGKRTSALSVSRVQRSGGVVEENPTTLGVVYSELSDEPIEKLDEFFGLKVTVGGSLLEFSGPSFHLRLLRTILELRRKGADPFSSFWCWYDDDSQNDEVHYTYSFFVVYRGEVVAEDVTFSDHSSSGFDPALFVLPERDDWRNARAWQQAHVASWYQSFYDDTKIGNLMRRRSDKPPLFHYAEKQVVADPLIGAGCNC